jgi:hypothetical protein
MYNPGELANRTYAREVDEPEPGECLVTTASRGSRFVRPHWLPLPFFAFGRISLFAFGRLLKATCVQERFFSLDDDVHLAYLTF